MAFEVFKIKGFQTSFRKDNDANGNGVLLVHVRNDIHANRRVDLETKNKSSLWLEISSYNIKSFLLGSMYRPPFLSDLSCVPWEILEKTDNIDAIGTVSNHFP